jgi:S-adenosylmethionine:tRNA ribosyltransferase-isomerase
VDTALVHVRASKGLKAGARVQLAAQHSALMIDRENELFVLKFSCDVLGFFEAHGQIPLPPYIERGAEHADDERYQTVYARARGAVAAPTAGLHFDDAIFAQLQSRRIAHAFVTLHVGAGTFAPMRVDDIDQHQMHTEYLEVPLRTCEAINAARAVGGRVIAVGTTVVRSLETAASAAPGTNRVAPYQGSTRIFIKPGYRFRAVDAMITNFHLPESTLLMLCSAFVGREALLAAYAHAVRARYRFFSYGDAMFLTPSRLASEAA